MFNTGNITFDTKPLTFELFTSQWLLDGCVGAHVAGMQR